MSLGLLATPEAATAEIVPVCDRTPEVRDEIVKLVPEVGDCADVTEAHLAAIKSDFFHSGWYYRDPANWVDPGRERRSPPPVKALRVGDFTGLSSVRTLYLDRTPLTTLPAGVFSGLSSLEILDWSYSSLTSLPPGAFSGLSSLQRLDLSEIQLTSLPPGAFSGLSSLQSLDLSGPRHPDYNRLTTLPEGTFTGLVSLRTLNLNRNNLASLPPGVFSGLGSLETLQLSRSQLASLFAGTFSGLASLETLYLYDNGLSSLPEDVFSGLASLEALYLYGNGLSSLPEDVFSDLASLEALGLSHNSLASLPEDVFSGLASLETLSLSHNSLASLPEDVFSGLASLEALDLYGNGLRSLPEGVFSGLASLEALGLYGNRLRSIPEGIFSGLVSLEFLNLYSNPLASLPEDVFSGLVSLETLILGSTFPLRVNVSLEWVGPGRFQARVHTGAPFEMRIPISVTNGMFDGESSHLTIPAGRGESDVLSVSRQPGTTSPVTVEVDRFPNMPQSHTGYVLVKTTLPLPVLGALSLNFPHFANGESIRSELVFVNVAATPIRPALYFFDTEGDLIAPESVVDVGVDRRVFADGSLTVRTEIESLGELTVLTHGRGPLVTGSVKVMADGPIGGVLRFDSPSIGVAGVGTGTPSRDAIFPVRRQESGINTGVAIRNLGEDPMTVSCQLTQRTNLRDEVEIPLTGHGQTAQFIDELFTGTYTGNFEGLVRCTAETLFSGVALEMDADNRIFTTLPMIPASPMGLRVFKQLDFAHFANGASITSDLVLVELV